MPSFLHRLMGFFQSLRVPSNPERQIFHLTDQLSRYILQDQQQSPQDQRGVLNGMTPHHAEQAKQQAKQKDKDKIDRLLKNCTAVSGPVFLTQVWPDLLQKLAPHFYHRSTSTWAQQERSAQERFALLVECLMAWDKLAAPMPFEALDAFLLASHTHYNSLIVQSLSLPCFLLHKVFRQEQLDSNNQKTTRAPQKTLDIPLALKHHNMIRFAVEACRLIYQNNLATPHMRAHMEGFMPAMASSLRGIVDQLDGENQDACNMIQEELFMLVVVGHGLKVTQEFDLGPWPYTDAPVSDSPPLLLSDYYAASVFGMLAALGPRHPWADRKTEIFKRVVRACPEIVSRLLEEMKQDGKNDIFCSPPRQPASTPDAVYAATVNTWIGMGEVFDALSNAQSLDLLRHLTQSNRVVHPRLIERAARADQAIIGAALLDVVEGKDKEQALGGKRKRM